MHTLTLRLQMPAFITQILSSINLRYLLFLSFAPVILFPPEKLQAKTITNDKRTGAINIPTDSASSYYYRLYPPAGHSRSVNISIPTPVNDEVKRAIQIPVNNNDSCSQSYDGTLNGATQSLPSCNPFLYSAPDLWYKFTATSVQHTITITPYNYTTYIFELFSGNADSLTSLGCVGNYGQDEGDTRTFRGFHNLIPGNTYYLRIYDKRGHADASTSFNICINKEYMVPNDACAEAINIPTDSSSLSTNFSNEGATLSMRGCSEVASNDVWFKFTATATRHQVKVVTTYNRPMVLQVFKGDCSALTSLACEYNSNVDTTVADIKNLVPGTTYYYRVYMSAGNEGLVYFRTAVLTPVTPVNDECQGAIQLPVNNDKSCSQSYTGTSGDASQSLPSCVNPKFPAADVWYKFIATATNHTVTLTPASATDFIFEVFDGACDSLRSIACTNSTGLNESEWKTLTGLVPGNPYYIRVYNNKGWSNNSLSYHLCISSPTPKPVLIDPGKHCSQDTLRVHADNIQPGNIVTAYLNGVTPANYDSVKQDVWFFPVAAGNNTIKVVQQDTAMISEPAEIIVKTLPTIHPQGKMILPVSICPSTDFEVTVDVDATSTPRKSSVELMEINSAGIIQTIGHKIYKGAPLTWNISGHKEAGIRRYFATITPSTDTLCGAANNTDTLAIKVEKYIVININWRGARLFTTETAPNMRYQWQRINGKYWEDIWNAREAALLLKQLGVYRLKVTLGICISYSNEIKVDNLGEINLFPNPVSRYLTVNRLSPADNWVTMEVRSLTGTTSLLRYNIKGKPQIEIDVSHLSPGIYMVILKGERNNIKTQKFIKI